MLITSQDVLDAFDSFGDASVHNQALQHKLRQLGFDVNDIVDAINDQFTQGVLAVDSLGAIRRA